MNISLKGIKQLLVGLTLLFLGGCTEEGGVICEVFATVTGAEVITDCGE